MSGQVNKRPTFVVVDEKTTLQGFFNEVSHGVGLARLACNENNEKSMHSTSNTVSEWQEIVFATNVSAGSGESFQQLT